MVIKSAIAKKLDVSSMQTCILCPGTSTFFSNESLMTHNWEVHRENKVVFFKIKELEDARNDLAEQLTQMKTELRNLYKRQKINGRPCQKGNGFAKTKDQGKGSRH